ncbi:hypothetical protein E1A91_D12G269200v1 [Gossypium mustelinum]|uniref:Uncharacterized protein n=1 Tax=Gossypium mustelinum TaxID=34275 RepID=A0A5D2SKP1_GOSMU|nr:hypothetical protein E1A91_D12G269200v1 [Gossypium mustelinum]
MEANPLTSEAIALTEKKMNMTLGELLAVWSFLNHKPVSNAAKEKAFKVRQYMDSCSSLRRGVLAQRKSNIQGNRFPFTAEASRRAAVAPLRSGAFNGKSWIFYNIDDLWNMVLITYIQLHAMWNSQNLTNFLWEELPNLGLS